MTLILWLTQCCLLSWAILLLLGEELVLVQKHGDLLCTKAVRVAGENTEQSSNNQSQCCKLEKSSRWQFTFGVLATAQICLFLVIFALQRNGKSPWPYLSFVCVACWLLNITLLFMKLVVYLTPEHETSANNGFISTLFGLLWNALTAIFPVAFKWIFSAVAHSTSSSDKREDPQNGLFFCSPGNGNDIRDSGFNIGLVLVVLIVAYLISSGYTIFVVLAHEDEQYEETCLKSDKSTRQRRSRKFVDQESDSSEKGRDGEGQGTKTTEEADGSRNCLRDLNRNKLTVAFIEDSDDESFVFGWRL